MAGVHTRPFLCGCLHGAMEKETMNKSGISRVILALGVALMIAAIPLGIGYYNNSEPKKIVIYTGAAGGGTADAANELRNFLIQKNENSSVDFVVTVETTSGTNEIISKLKGNDNGIGIVKVASQDLSGTSVLLKLYSEHIHYFSNTVGVRGIVGAVICTGPEKSGSAITLDSILKVYNTRPSVKISDQNTSGNTGQVPEDGNKENATEVRNVKWESIEECANNAIKESANRHIPNGRDVRPTSILTVSKLRQDREVRIASNVNLNLQNLPLADAIRSYIPYMSGSTIPEGLYRGWPKQFPGGDIKTLAVDTYLMAKDSANKDTMKEIITRIIDGKHYLSLKDPSFMEIIELSKNTSKVKIHPGAQAYIERLEPSFWKEYIQEIEATFALLSMIGGGILVGIGSGKKFIAAAVSFFNRRQK